MNDNLEPSPTLLQDAAQLVRERIKNQGVNDRKERLFTVLDKMRYVYDENDNMLVPTLSGTQHYIDVGLSAIECVDEALKRANCKAESIKKILDLPCGYGRVMRTLKAGFPKAELNACELITEAVEYCEKAFDAVPIHSTEDISKLNLSAKFDLIWCGSLITHLDQESTINVLDFFYRHLNEGGVCVFTTHGIGSVASLENGKLDYGLLPPQIEKILAHYYDTNYGYVSYRDDCNYGISISTTQKILELAYDVGNWHNVYYKKEGWDNHQDVFAFKKA